MFHLARLFHSQTSHKHTTPLPPENNWPEEWTTIFYKTYSKSTKFSLSQPSSSLNFDLASALVKRHSTKSFSPSSELSLDQISTLLHYSCGLVKKSEEIPSNHRSYASAGARYPLEVYLAVRRVDDLKSGIYHYHVPTHSLESLDRPEAVSEIYDSISPGQSWLREASAVLIISGVFDRVLNKYGDRGYRYLLEEVGAVTHNFYLLAASLGLSVSAIGGFDEHVTNESLRLDGTDEAVVALVAIGKG